MSDIALLPHSEKVAIAEIDIGKLATLWFNSGAGMWYRIFTAIYPLIDASLRVGVTAEPLSTTIGSVASDAAQLLLVPDAATCQATEMSFFFDSSTKALYIHLQNGDEPSLHRILYGLVLGVSDRARIVNGFIYEGKLRSAPSISKTKDPLFFGKIAREAWNISIDNTDGSFDGIAEDEDLFGNAVRLLAGYGGESYSALTRCGQGLVGKVSRGPELFEVSTRDKRMEFSALVPSGVFDATTYPDIDPGNVGKAIRLTYGYLRQIPVICTNEKESPAPANYTFRFSDTTFGTGATVHPIKAITQVYVDGVAKATSASDLTAGTFSLAAANYSPGQKVTMDLQGYEDALGALIENALDVLMDIFTNCLGIPNIPSAFDQAEWAAARAAAASVCYFTKAPVKVEKIIEDICASALIIFFPKWDGRYTARVHSASRAVTHSFTAEDNLVTPSTDDDPEQVIASTRIGYSKNWAEDDWIWLNDTSKKESIFARWKSREEPEFETLLVDEAAAQAFSDKMLLLGGAPQKIVHHRFKMQALGLELGDYVETWVVRQDGTGLLGQVKGEVIGISFDMLAAEFELDVRVVEIYGETIYVQGEYWGDSYWGDGHWAETHKEAV